MNEQEQFLKALEEDNTEVDILEQPLTPVTPPEPEEPEAPADEVEDDNNDENDDDEGVKPKNRRERRLLKKLQEEKESSSFLAGKLAARSEAERVVSEESDYLKTVENIYGNATPEAQLATDLLKKAIIGARDDAKRAAIEEWRTERQKELEEVQQAEGQLDAIVEEIEDTYDVTLTPTQEKSYFQLLQKMSPKDRSGNVIDYADPHAVWEVFQERVASKRTDNRAKDLSARSMVQSGASKDSTLQDDTTARALQELGII